MKFGNGQKTLTFDRSSRGRGRPAATNTNSSLADKYAYRGGAGQSRSDRAKLRNLKRGASVSEEDEIENSAHQNREQDDDEEIDKSNSDIRDDEIAEEMDMQDEELSNSVIEDDEIDLAAADRSDSDESAKVGKRRSAQRSNESTFVNRRSSRARQIRY